MTNKEYIKEITDLFEKLADLQLKYAEICELQALKIMEDLSASY